LHPATFRTPKALYKKPPLDANGCGATVTNAQQNRNNPVSSFSPYSEVFYSPASGL